MTDDVETAPEATGSQNRGQMTKLRDLERHLRAHGCEPLREGARHSVWHNPDAKRRTTVPRHAEIPYTTAVAICRQLEVPAVESR